MPALRGLFQGIHSGNTQTNPLERKYLVLFQEFCRKHTDRLSKYQQSARKEEKFVPGLASDVFKIADATSRDWTIICTVIQWLGTPLGQWYLRSVKDKKR